VLQLLGTQSNGASQLEEAVVQEHAGHPCVERQPYQISSGYTEGHGLTRQFHEEVDERSEQFCCLHLKHLHVSTQFA
jgi:hypothetical protein